MMDKIQKILALAPLLTGTEFKLLTYLAMVPHEEVLRSQIRLAKRLGCQRKSIHNSVTRLEKDFEVLIVARSEKNSRQVNGYAVDWIRIDHLIPASPENSSVDETKPVEAGPDGITSSELPVDTTDVIVSDDGKPKLVVSNPVDTTVPDSGLPMKPVVSAIPSNDKDVLDPEISALIDELEEAQDRDNPVVEYLTSQGQVKYSHEHGWALFQIASGLKFRIDKDEIYRFLRARNLNAYAAFISRVDEFSRTPEARPPRIDIPLEESCRDVNLRQWLANKLADHPAGFSWVWDQIKVENDDPDGYRLMPFEFEYRNSFITFMRRYKLRTLDDVIEKAKPVSAEIEAQQ